MYRRGFARKAVLVCVAGTLVGLMQVSPATAAPVVRTLSATTNFGRTCTIEFRGDSPYRVLPTSSYIEHRGSLACSTPNGNMYFSYIYSSIWYDPASNFTTQDALWRIANAGRSTSGSTAGCGGHPSGYGMNSCSYVGDVRGFPGQRYQKDSRAHLLLPMTSSTATGERWTGVPSGCTVRWVYNSGVSGPVHHELSCSVKDYITAA